MRRQWLLGDHGGELDSTGLLAQFVSPCSDGYAGAGGEQPLLREGQMCRFQDDLAFDKFGMVGTCHI